MFLKNLTKKFSITIFLLLIIGSASVFAQQYRGLPVTKVGLITAFRKKVPTRQILEIITRCGVNFQMTAATKKELTAAGASGAILTAAQNNYRNQATVKDFDADFRRGFDLYQAGRSEEAIAAFRASIAVKPSAEAFYNLGLAYEQLEQHDNAIAAFGQALQLDKSDAQAWLGLGDAYYNSEKMDEAIIAYRQSLMLDPNNKIAWNYLGDAYQTGGRYREAIDAYQKALRLDSGYGEAWRNVCSTTVEMYSFGDAQAGADYSNALYAGRQAVKFSPDDAEAWQCLGNVSFETENYADAVKAFQRAVQLDPNNADLRNSLREAQDALNYKK